MPAPSWASSELASLAGRDPAGSFGGLGRRAGLERLEAGSGPPQVRSAPGVCPPSANSWLVSSGGAGPNPRASWAGGAAPLPPPPPGRRGQHLSRPCQQLVRRHGPDEESVGEARQARLVSAVADQEDRNPPARHGPDLGQRLRRIGWTICGAMTISAGRLAVIQPDRLSPGSTATASKPADTAALRSRSAS